MAARLSLLLNRLCAFASRPPSAVPPRNSNASPNCMVVKYFKATSNSMDAIRRICSVKNLLSITLFQNPYGVSPALIRPIASLAALLSTRFPELIFPFEPETSAFKKPGALGAAQYHFLSASSSLPDFLKSAIISNRSISRDSRSPMPCTKYT